MSNLDLGTEPSLLFICTSNRCRSVMAEALWRRRLPEVAPDWARWRVGSAGTWAEEGDPPLRGVAQLLQERGVELAVVVSRRVTAELLSAHRLTLVMEPGHKEALHLEFPAMRDRIHLLSEMAGFTTSVEDPTTLAPEAMAACLEEIDTWLELGAGRIVALARGGSSADLVGSGSP